MSAHNDPNSPINETVTFEPTDVATRPVVTSVALLAVFTVIFTFAAHLTFFGLAGREAANSPEPSPLAAEYAAKEPPLPRLQIDPKADLVALRAAEAKALSSLTWVDKEKGVVQVPIERAMEMLLAKGLPSRQGAVPARMAPKGTAPRQFSEGAGAPDWNHGEAAAAHGGHGAAAPAHGSAHAPAHAEPAEGHGH